MKTKIVKIITSSTFDFFIIHFTFWYKVKERTTGEDCPHFSSRFTITSTTRITYVHLFEVKKGPKNTNFFLFFELNTHARPNSLKESEPQGLAISISIQSRNGSFLKKYKVS